VLLAAPARTAGRPPRAAADQVSPPLSTPRGCCAVALVSPHAPAVCRTSVSPAVMRTCHLVCAARHVPSLLDGRRRLGTSRAARHLPQGRARGPQALASRRRSHAVDVRAATHHASKPAAQHPTPPPLRIRTLAREAWAGQHARHPRHPTGWRIGDGTHAFLLPARVLLRTRSVMFLPSMRRCVPTRWAFCVCVCVCAQ
jgi:hypothetical protein